MDDNVKTFLDKIQELKETKNKVYVLSTGKQLDSTPITFKQQKELISTIADGSSGALKTQKIINDIIVTNTGNNDLKITDKLPIILKLRIDSIGKSLKIGKDQIDLNEVLEKSKNLKFETSKTVGDKIVVELEVPTITQETKVIQTTIEVIKKEGDSELGTNIGNVYTYEIVKYIKSIKFDDQELIFQNIPVKDRYKVVENLPLTTNKDIIEFIQDIRSKENEVLTVLVNDEEKTVDIDVSFFDS